MIRSDIIKDLVPVISDQLVVTNIGLPSQEMHLLDDQPTNFYMLITGKCIFNRLHSIFSLAFNHIIASAGPCYITKRCFHSGIGNLITGGPVAPIIDNEQNEI